MYCLCVNVYCHRVTTQLQLINISFHNLHCHFNWARLNDLFSCQIPPWTTQHFVAGNISLACCGLSGPILNPSGLQRTPLLVLSVTECIQSNVALRTHERKPYLNLIYYHGMCLEKGTKNINQISRYPGRNFGCSRRSVTDSANLHCHWL